MSQVGPTSHDGSVGRYAKGCRCIRCRVEHAAYAQARRDRLRQQEEEGYRRVGGELLVQLVKLEKLAERYGWAEALAVVQMHIWATQLDLSLDALKRGEL